MRLLRCHIENFGVLSGFDYEFESGLTVICRENGFGPCCCWPPAVCWRSLCGTVSLATPAPAC